MDTIGIIGSGNMAEAIIKGVIRSGLYQPQAIMASDVRAERLQYMAEEYKIRTTLDNLDLVQHARVLLVCVKPQNVKALLDLIEGKTHQDTLIISIAAGITTDYISKRLTNCQVIRVMPNTPAMIGEGASAMYSGNASKEAINLTLKLFGAVGRAVIVEKEELIDAVTSVSGSGPAYFFLLMEEMIKTAVKMGIPVNVASDLVVQTAKGAGLLAAQAFARNESPSELRRKVTSPNGTTEAALKVFEKLDLAGILFAGLERAQQRSGELSREVANG